MILALCFKRCAVFDNLSLFAQSMGCPTRLIKTEPDKLSLKGLLHLKILMHTHTHAYFLSYDKNRIVLGNSQIPRQIQRQRQIEVSGNAATICCVMSFPAFRYLGMDMSRGYAHDRRIVVPCPALDKREALLGGSLVSFKFLVIITVVSLR